jgi:PAS domain S-box-containing protein
VTAEPLRLVILEHTPADAELSLHELTRAGYAVTHRLATSRAEFLAQLDRAEFDVVLADYRLPDWTGLDAFAELRTRGFDQPFILVTGTLGEERAVEAVKLGVADYVLKQNLARLPLVVRRALDERRVLAERARALDLIRKLTQAVEQSPASVIITDTAGTIEYVNRRYTELTGFTAGESLGKNPRILRSDDTPPAVYADLWRQLHEGRMWQGELHNRMKSGELRWHAVTISPVRDTSGVVTHYLSTQEDITDRKRAERALRDRDERFGQLADHIREVFFVVDARSGETLYINPAYEQIWGRSCSSLYQDPRSFLDPVPEEDRARVLAGIAALQQGHDPGETEFRVVRPDGETRWVLAHAVPIRNERGEIYRISGAALDVTERRGAQEALEDSEALFRRLTEASFDAIVLSEEGIVVDANRGFADLCGATPDQVVGRPITEFFADESLETLRHALTEGNEATYALVTRGPEGAGRFLEATSRTHLARGHRRQLTALRDLTEKRALESQFHQAQKMEAVGRLAGGVAHDFNNLLTVIISYTDLMLGDLPPGDPRLGDLEQIQQAANGAAALTRQLLAFSRQQVIAPRRLDLDDGVRGAEKMLRRVIGEDIELVTRLGAGPAMKTVKIDPGQLEQIVLNLAVNARDAMPGGGRLQIETSIVSVEGARARELGAPPGPYAQLTVRDTGVGMTEDTRARLFEPFFTTKAPGKGTGLGLSTVYGIVKQAGGFIIVASVPGQGATFRVHLPALDEPADGTGLGSTTQAPRGSETVLLVEDSAAVRAATREILQRNGYQVLEAPAATDALALVAKHRGPIHLLLTDMVMPGMNGRALAQEFARAHPRSPILFMSGYTDDRGMRDEAPDASAYLQMPFSSDTLARKVR